MRLKVIALVVLFSSLAQAKSVQQETCETLYNDVALETCLEATTYPTFALLHDYMEMAKLKIKQGDSARATEFIEAAQKAIGIK